MSALEALWMKASDMAARAMLNPPDAEPVMPASDVVVIAWLSSGSEIDFNASAITRNPGNAAITAPKPYSEAVFMDASNAPAMAERVPSANAPTTGFHANTKTLTMPISSAPSTAQMAV